MNGETLPSSMFKWRTKLGDEIPLQDMETSHVFNTFLMIWNHAAPIEARSQRFNHYQFGPYYTKKYILQAFVNLYAELKKRTDLSPLMVGRLRNIENYLENNNERRKTLLEGRTE